MKLLKIIQTILFSLVALSYIDLLIGSNVGRHYFNYLSFGTNLRYALDIVLLLLSVMIAIQPWQNSVSKKLYWGAGALFILFNLFDIHNWIMLTRTNHVYYIILTIHSLPIVLLLAEFLSKQHKIWIRSTLSTTIMIAIWSFVLSYSIPDFTSLQTDADFESYFLDMHVLYWLYYICAVFSYSLLMSLLIKKIGPDVNKEMSDILDL